MSWKESFWLMIVGGILCIASLGCLILSSLSGIFFLLMMLCYIIFGMIILGVGCYVAWSVKNPFFILNGIIFGLFVALCLVFTWCSIKLNPSNNYFIFGTINFNTEFLSILITIIVIFTLSAIFLVASRMKNKGVQTLFCCFQIVLIAAYCILFSVVGTKSYSDNTLSDYDFSSMQTEYRALNNANIYYFDTTNCAWPIQIRSIQLPLGKFQEGEELYLLSSTKLYGYFEVSNGEKCGYVKEEELEPLYTTSWQAKDDQVPIYEAIPYEVQTANAGKATLHKKGDQIVGYLRLGESFTKRSESKNGILIETSSGIIGYVDSGSVEEVKTPIE